jgi:hypothetical protein
VKTSLSPPQCITYGTSAWRISMGRRQVVESVNAALKGVFTDLGRGFMRVMGVTKMTVMLGFTLASFNLDRVRRFRAKHLLDEEGRPNSTGLTNRLKKWPAASERPASARPEFEVGPPTGKAAPEGAAFALDLGWPRA